MICRYITIFFFIVSTHLKAMCFRMWMEQLIMTGIIIVKFKVTPLVGGCFHLLCSNGSSSSCNKNGCVMHEKFWVSRQLLFLIVYLLCQSCLSEFAVVPKCYYFQMEMFIAWNVGFQHKTTHCSLTTFSLACLLCFLVFVKLFIY